MFRSLRVRNYRLYASGQLVSLTGTWMQRVAQDWLVLQLTDSGTALGIVTALQFLPSLLFGMWGGVLADRYDKRILLFGTQTSMALAAVIMGALDLAGVVRYWHVLALALVLGMISAVDAPVRQSFAMEMVGRDLLPNAVAINSTTFNAARILGPAVAGVLIGVMGTGPAFLINAATSAAVLSSLAMMRKAELFPAPALGRGEGQLRAGIAYVRRRSDLLLILALIFTIGTFGLNFQLTTALMAKQVFHQGASGFGLLSTSLAVGSCLGAVLAARRSTRPSQLLLIVAAIGFSVAEIGAGLMPSFLTTALLLVPTGWLMMTLTTAANSAVQLSVTPTMRGRVMALYMVCFMGGTPAGAPLIGWLAGVAGPRWGLIGGGLVCLLVALAMGAFIGRRRRLTPAYLATRLVPAG